MDSEQIHRAALALPEAARAELAYRLVRSGNPLAEERPETELAEAMPDLREIQQAALALPEAELDELCRNLLISLEPQEGLVSEEEAEAYWIQEAERRVKEIDRGEAQMIPHAEVMRKARELLQ